MGTSVPFRILMIGKDPVLGYLLERYAQRAGCCLVRAATVPALEHVRAVQPQILLFASLEELEEAQPLIAALAGQDFFILVCTSLSETPRARELGADHCFIHPITYSEFCRVLSSAGASLTMPS